VGNNGEGKAYDAEEDLVTTITYSKNLVLSDMRNGNLNKQCRCAKSEMPYVVRKRR
jgi:hypothetical protein